jgi:predicted esterase
VTASGPVEFRITVPRSARYFTLGGGNAASEAWFVLHGFGQLAARFVNWFEPVASPTRLVVAPEALNHYYTDHKEKKVGATWMTSEDRLAQIGDYVRYLDLVVDELVARTQVNRIEVHGFSQGCATASRWVMQGRVRPSRLVLWGGSLPPDLDLPLHADRLNTLDLTLVLGDRDQFISQETAAGDQARLDGAGVRYTLCRFRGGHVIPWQVLNDLAGVPGGSPS